MKFALILLSTLVVITHQQFYHQQREIPWWSYSPQRVLNNYYQHPLYDNAIDSNPFYRYYKPARPVAYFQDEGDLNLGTVEETNEEEYPDVESRVKSRGRYRPSFMQQNQRFFGLLAGNAASSNPLIKTVKFTLTSTINITSIVSCISSGLFTNAAAQNVICRRKRERGPNSWDESEDVQFIIDPSETQPLATTDQPSFDGMREDRQMEDGEGYHGISSSKDESDVGSSKPESSRDKRFFFNYFLTSSTVTSYTFGTTVVTKALAIASVAAGAAGAAAAAGPLLCRPSGYVIC